MSLRTYTLAVSLAAIVGLLVAAVPLVRGALEYRRPWIAMPEPQELSSLDMFITAKAKKEEARRARYYPEEEGMWQGMYEAAKAQHVQNASREIEFARQKAARTVIAYGSLAGICLLLLTAHLLWARRVSGQT